MRRQDKSAYAAAATARLQPWQVAWMERHRLACRIDWGVTNKGVARALDGADDELRRAYRNIRRQGGDAWSALRAVGR